MHTIPQGRRIDIKVFEAKGMGARASDYQARVLLGGGPLCMTTVASSTDTPFWGAAFSFSDLPTSSAKCITVQVGRPVVGLLQLRTARSAQWDVVAHVTLPLRPGEPALEEWVAMDGPDDAPLGSMRIKLHTVDELLLPRARYAALSELLNFETGGGGGSSGSSSRGSSRRSSRRSSLSSVGSGANENEAVPSTAAPAGGDGIADSSGAAGSTTTVTSGEGDTNADPASLLRPDILPETVIGEEVLKALQHVTPSSERPALCKTLLHCTGTYSYLYAVCKLEIEATVKENVLFRGNSLASCSVDLYMKLQTIERSTYLENTLAETVQYIYDSKQSCEVDPTRIQNSERDPGKVAGGMKRLQAITAEVWHAVKSSVEDVRCIQSSKPALMDAEGVPGRHASRHRWEV